MNSDRITCILDSGFRAVLVIIGGGSGALHSLLSTPGASRFVADAQIPYSPAALEGYLGEPVEQAVSPATARALAVRAFEKSPPAEGGAKGGVEFPTLGKKKRHETPLLPTLGISCTAALKTDRERRGADRAFIGIKTETVEKLYALYFSEASRTAQEALLSDWLLILIAQAVGAERGLLLPGSFNPVHQGHLNLLNITEKITGLHGIFELSSANFDKPDIREEEILRRVAAIKDIPVALTHAPFFIQKAERFPNTTFVLGFDTAARLVENNPALQGMVSGHWKNQWEIFQTLEISFLVAGRVFQPLEKADGCMLQGAGARDCRFQTLEDLNLPAGFETLFEAIPETRFREDISSTELRG